jgi:adenosylmethionine-8-amino-7-oxononanoate aminotransferase
MSVCDPEGGMHSLWRGVLPEQIFADVPPDGFHTLKDAGYEQHLADLIGRHADELAAVIVEPVVQGAGGMRFHSPDYLRVLRDLCDAHQVLLIFDEIATGFGRSGRLFAADHAAVSPDVMCVGKALTGGYLSMAATLCTSRIAQGISRGDVPVLAHGPTFMGNPLAASIANASIDLLLDDATWAGWDGYGNLRTTVAGIESALAKGLAPARELPGVRDVRVLGAIGVVELDHEVDVPAAAGAAVDAGVWLRPFRNLVYTMPPYITTDADLARIAAGVVAAAKAG